MNNYFDPKNFAKKTVLTIYAHADDEVLPAAGTLNIMSKAGWNVHCLILTDGNLSSSSMKDKRHKEAEEAGKIIGATYEFYALEECNFSTQVVIKVAEEAIKRWQPDLIITHAPQPEKYGHRDHEVCAIAVSNVATRTNIPLWYSAPPVFLRGFEPNFFVDITSVIEEKVAAIGCYESELNKAFMQLDAILVLSRFWARELGQKDGYFEAFEISRQWVDASFFEALANSKKQVAHQELSNISQT
ncbi:PIG-L deacetylase family protein [Calothrix sp. PCC 7507]|uniref:PIG-L deacetylase family protein n=1 Tax=Calothrix sp. PCC 7507 TaxID=99598 RepID=UPI00029EFA7D|nr:PIG-L deacetylase family protein [Calothrix sp. PCC 7507]AFY31429.1 LmbE family protein [Calothrix sp. PCC 7507]